MLPAPNGGKERRERIHDERPEHYQKSERQQGERPDQHQPERLQAQHPPRSRLHEAIGAIKPNPKRFDGARSEVKRENSAEREQSTTARRRQNALDLLRDRARDNLGPFGENKLRRLVREIAGSEASVRVQDTREPRRAELNGRRVRLATVKALERGGYLRRERQPDEHGFHRSAITESGRRRTSFASPAELIPWRQARSRS